MRANLSFPRALSHGNRDVWGAGGEGGDGEQGNRETPTPGLVERDAVKMPSPSLARRKQVLFPAPN